MRCAVWNYNPWPTSTSCYIQTFLRWRWFFWLIYNARATIPITEQFVLRKGKTHWVSKCSRQTGKICFWNETNEIYRLTSRNISLWLFSEDFRNRRKNSTIPFGGHKTIWLIYKRVSLPRAPQLLLLALEQIFLCGKLAWSARRRAGPNS